MPFQFCPYTKFNIFPISVLNGNRCEDKDNNENSYTNPYIIQKIISLSKSTRGVSSFSQAFIAPTTKML